MGGQPTFFVLDDKMVAVFSVLHNNCEVKMECLFSKTGIEDYTVEYFGPLEKKSELLKLAKTKAQSIFNENVFSV